MATTCVDVDVSLLSEDACALEPSTIRVDVELLRELAYVWVALWMARKQ